MAIVDDSKPLGTVSPETIAALLPRFTVCEVLVVFGALLVIAGGLLQIYLISDLRGLIAEFGWGQVPAGQVPNGEAYDLMTYACQFVGYAIAISAFFTGMARVRRIAAEALGAQFEYGFGWTVGSLFIPIICLFRPWVGLAEIRSAITGYTRRSLRRYSGPDGEGGGATWALGAAFIIGTGVTTISSAAMSDTVPPGPDGFATWSGNMLAVLCLQLIVKCVVYGGFIAYLASLHGTLRRVVLSVGMLNALE